MYYLVEGYKRVNGRLESSPTRTQAVTITQLQGAIVRMLATGVDIVQVSSISEEVFALFYQEKKHGEARV